MCLNRIGVITINDNKYCRGRVYSIDYQYTHDKSDVKLHDFYFTTIKQITDNNIVKIGCVFL